MKLLGLDRLTKEARFVGICPDTRLLTIHQPEVEVREASRKAGLVAADPVRPEIGAGPIIAVCLESAPL